MTVFLLGLALAAHGQSLEPLQSPILDPKQTLLEAQVYLASRVPVVRYPTSAADWDSQRESLRKRILEEIVFRGEARRWRTAERKVEWGETLTGDGYRIRKLKFEVIPGWWTPAVVYEPQSLSGRVPAVLNVNGHEKVGIAQDYIQQRCVQLARMGYVAFNAEWLGRGVLDLPGNDHYSMPQIDLTGTSGLAVFYLQMERSLDILLQHANVDPARVGVTGLSGGGWQTTLITALDARIQLSVPVAGHSSYVTRAQWPALDLGDSEQTPSDLASVADYLHLSGMTAPRPLMFINNAKDTCCFRADYAMGPMLQSMRPIYEAFGAGEKLSYYINHSQGHNYDQFSRRELYRFLRRHFEPGAADPSEEKPEPPRTAEALTTPLPPGNLTFQTLALRLADGLPRPGQRSREDLARLIRYREGRARVEGGPQRYQFRWEGSWTLPGVALGPERATEAVILLGDEGKKALATHADRLVADGKRVLAVDPFLIGESGIEKRDFLFAMLLAGLGERPLGLQAAQLAAAARWLAGQGHRVTIEAHGRRTSLAAVVTAAMEPAVSGATLHGSLRSLKQGIVENVKVSEFPELYCFGLLEQFDIPQIAALGKNVELRP